jgi:hypothetical protein
VTKVDLEQTKDPQSRDSDTNQASPQTNRLDRASNTDDRLGNYGETNQRTSVTLSMANFQRAAVLVEHGVTAPRMRAKYSTGDILRLVQTCAGYLVAEPHDGRNTNKMLLKGTLSNPSFIRLSGERAHLMANLGIDLVTEGPLIPAAEWVSNYFGSGRTKLVFYPSSILGRSMLQKQISAILAASINCDEVDYTDGALVMTGSSAIYVLSEIALKNGRRISVSDPESVARTPN